MTKQEFLDKYLVQRRGTDCLKWDRLNELYGDSDLISMWIADTEFKTCDEILEALHKRIDHGAFGYSVLPEDYADAFSGWMQRHHGFRIDKEWLRFSAGCVSGIAWLLNTFTEPGDACLILTPVYYPFHNVIKENNRRLVTVDLHYENGTFSIDLEAMEQASAMRSLVECLSDERAKLVDGSPCPLCGAVHHPYAETQPAILSDDSHKLERTRKDLKAAQTTVASLAREVAKLDGTIKAERGTLNELQTLFLLETQTIRELTTEWSIEEGPVSDIRATQLEALEKAAALTDRIKQIVTLDDESELAHNGLNTGFARLEIPVGGRDLKVVATLGDGAEVTIFEDGLSALDV